MDAIELLHDAFGRIHELVHDVLADLSADALVWRSDPQANTIGWLVWHLTRIQDDHVAGVAGRSQVWEADGWPERFGLPPGTMDHGYGHSPDDVIAVQPRDPRALTEYHHEVAERTHSFLDRTHAAALDRVVDRSWDPPVTAGVRLVSVISDDLQHVGQAAHVRGLWERSTRPPGHR